MIFILIFIFFFFLTCLSINFILLQPSILDEIKEDFEEQGNCIQSNQGWMVEKLNLDIQGKEAFLFHGTHRSLVQVIQERVF